MLFPSGAIASPWLSLLFPAVIRGLICLLLRFVLPWDSQGSVRVFSAVPSACLQVWLGVCVPGTERSLLGAACCLQGNIYRDLGALWLKKKRGVAVIVPKKPQGSSWALRKV